MYYHVTLDCGLPSISNGEVSASNGTTLDETATVSCIDGYQLLGSSVIKCTSAGWNDTVTCTLKGENMVVNIH